VLLLPLLLPLVLLLQAAHHAGLQRSSGRGDALWVAAVERGQSVCCSARGGLHLAAVGGASSRRSCCCGRDRGRLGRCRQGRGCSRACFLGCVAGASWVSSGHSTPLRLLLLLLLLWPATRLLHAALLAPRKRQWQQHVKQQQRRERLPVRQPAGRRVFLASCAWGHELQGRGEDEVRRSAGRLVCRAGLRRGGRPRSVFGGACDEGISSEQQQPWTAT
jgi:hypothetical protein